MPVSVPTETAAYGELLRAFNLGRESFVVLPFRDQGNDCVAVLVRLPGRESAAAAAEARDAEIRRKREVVPVVEGVRSSDQ